MYYLFNITKPAFCPQSAAVFPMVLVIRRNRRLVFVVETQKKFALSRFEKPLMEDSVICLVYPF
jgi:hypothetical protein